MSMIAIPRGRQQHDMCCCTWDFANWVRTYTHPECTTHGEKHVRERASQEVITKLKQRRSDARRAIDEMNSDLVLLPGRIAAQKRLIENLTEQLKELNHESREDETSRA